MDKITFRNGRQPAINDTNLNQMQTNIENEINSVSDSVSTNANNISELSETVGNLISKTTNTNGTAIKFSNGIMICTKTVSITNRTVNTAAGSLYASSEISLGNFAETFSSNPTVNVTLTTNDYNGFIGEVKRASNLTSDIGSIIIYRPTATTSGQYTVNVIAIGTYEN